MSKISRRGFIKGAVGTAAGLSTINFLNPSVGQAQGGPGNNLVFINLGGGMDGLGAYPYIEGEIYQYLMEGVGAVTARRPLLSFYPPGHTPVEGDLNDVALTSTVLTNSQNGLPHKLGLNPGFRNLLTTANGGVDVGGNIKIIKGVGSLGYENGSHEDMSQYLAMLSPNFLAADQTGWTARASDIASLPSFAFWGVCSCGNLPYFNTQGIRPIVVNSFSSLEYTDRSGMTSIGNSGGDDDNRYTRQLAHQLAGYPGNPTAAEARFNAGMQALTPAKFIVDAIETTALVGDYTTNPSGFKNNFKQIAQILKYKQTNPELVNRPSIIYATHGGFDTHDNQVYIYNLDFRRGALQTHLRDIADTLAQFIKDLQAANIWGKTTIVLMSEFGRTTRQNSSQDTVGSDHARASSVMILGGSINGGVVGDDPAISQIINSNGITSTIAFETPIGAVLDWLGISGTAVLPTYNRTSGNALGLFV